MNLAYGLFMAEKEGYLNTKESHINKTIKLLKELREEGKPLEYCWVQLGAAAAEYEFTDREIQRIRDAASI